MKLQRAFFAVAVLLATSQTVKAGILRTPAQVMVCNGYWASAYQRCMNANSGTSPALQTPLCTAAAYADPTYVGCVQSQISINLGDSFWDIFGY